MDSRMGAAQGQTTNYEPSSDLIQEDECDTLVLYLPGFTKEQLRVQVTSSGALRISGARQNGENKWSSFQKSFPVSANCDASKISAKFEGGILYVKQPKLIVPDKKTPETPRPPTPAMEPPAPKIDPRARPEKATPSDDQHKKSGVRDFPEKRDQIKEEKPTKEKGDKNGERKYPQEKSNGADLDQKVPERNPSDKRKNAAGNIDADLADKGTKYHGIAGGDDYSRYVGSPAARPKMSGQSIKMVMVVLFAFLLGIYVSNLSWFSKTPVN